MKQVNLEVDTGEKFGDYWLSYSNTLFYLHQYSVSFLVTWLAPTWQLNAAPLIDYLLKGCHFFKNTKTF